MASTAKLYQYIRARDYNAMDQVLSSPETITSYRDGWWTLLHTLSHHRNPTPPIALVEAVCRSHPESLLLQTWDGHTPLHIAVRYSSSDIVKCLMQCNPSAATILNRNITTPLHMACANGDVEKVRVIVSFCPEACSILGKNKKTALQQLHSGEYEDYIAKALNTRVEGFKVADHLVMEYWKIGCALVQAAAASLNPSIGTNTSSNGDDENGCKI